MGVRFPSQGSNVLVNNTITTTVETVLCTSPPLSLPLDFALVLLSWYLLIGIIGTAATTATVRIRRGAGTGGTVINNPVAVPVTAGSSVSLSGCYIDTPGAVAGQQYSVTVTMGAATANSTPSDTCLLAYAL